MKDGEIVQVGAPMEVYRNPADTFVAGFLASPPMNLVAGRLEPDQGGLAAVAGSARFVLPPALRDAYAAQSGNAVTLGLRPEDFHLVPGNAKMSQTVPVATVATEVLGPEVILVCELGGRGGPEVMVRCPRDFSASPGQALTLHYDLSQIHLFDKNTGKVFDRPRLA
jgi:ABC-type sugar transport system ATPase subunit